MGKQENQKNKRQVWGLLKEYGFSDKEAAGIMGSIDVETDGTFDYKTQQKGGGPGYGLFQLDFKKKAYYKYLEKKQKTDPNFKDSARAQIEFMHNTIRGDDDITVGAPIIKKINEKLKNGTVKEIAECFSTDWERPSVPHLERRLKAAEKYDKEFCKPQSTIPSYVMPQQKIETPKVEAKITHFLNETKPSYVQQSYIHQPRTDFVRDFLSNYQNVRTNQTHEMASSFGRSSFPHESSHSYGSSGDPLMKAALSSFEKSRSGTSSYGSSGDAFMKAALSSFEKSRSGTSSYGSSGDALMKAALSSFGKK